MAQKYNIYINEKKLIICTQLPKYVQSYQVIEVEGFDFEIFFHTLNNHQHTTFVLLCPNPKFIFSKIKTTIKVIEAAGGFVKSDEDKYLFIKRNGYWDLPKGKLEPNEKKKQAALREVEEECGITVESLGKKITKTYHIYELKGKLVLKISHWYRMKAIANQALVPQIEEGITEVQWLPKSKWDIVKTNTYPSILEVLAYKV
ncbi:MAG: NUDIX domain-containing protein [Sphingobacteriales bacterium]|nr:MAG: NUDIX domain-containing protein [Sphingobacteriales bacterium]TAF81290.1 MAG: NUDIX domain-containing protein [Sphingobacteriales bacterium]